MSSQTIDIEVAKRPTVTLIELQSYLAQMAEAVQTSEIFAILYRFASGIVAIKKSALSLAYGLEVMCQKLKTLGKGVVI